MWILVPDALILDLSLHTIYTCKDNRIVEIGFSFFAAE